MVSKEQILPFWQAKLSLLISIFLKKLPKYKLKQTDNSNQFSRQSEKVPNINPEPDESASLAILKFKAIILHLTNYSICLSFTYPKLISFLLQMGSISLSKNIRTPDFDDWIVTSVRAYDQPAAELNFIDVRHSYCLLTLANPAVQSRSCGQLLVDCWFGFKECIGCCLNLCTCCLCCSCLCCCCTCEPSSEVQLAKTEREIVVLLELTGSATKGAFLNQQIVGTKMVKENVKDKHHELTSLTHCPSSELLILKGDPDKKIRYAEVRKKVMDVFEGRKYDIKTNNCFHFVMTAVQECGISTGVLEKRLLIIEENVRKHNVIVPVLDRMMGGSEVNKNESITPQAIK